MEKLVKRIITTQYDNLDENLKKIPINKRAGLVVVLNDVKYEFLIHIKSTKDLICLGPSGLPNEDYVNKFKERPVFTRHTWNFNESTIFYNDNTRYVWDGAIGAGWGIGLPEDYFLENIKNIILKITRFFNIKNENILFYGSSMGGFTSIQLATMIKNSYAIAENPQIDATKWMKSFYIKNGMFSKLYSEETILKLEPYKYDITEMIKKEKYIPNLTIVHDVNNEDIANHLMPFIDELNKLPFKKDDYNRIKIIIEPNSQHVPIPKNKLFDLLKMHKILRHENYSNINNISIEGIKAIENLNLFDKEYYLKSNPELKKLDPLTHYLLIGWKEGRNPSKEFDNNFYLNKYPAIKSFGLNPLIHYAIWGIKENRLINKNEEFKSFIQLLENSNLFNESYYLKQSPTLNNLTPIEHYLLHGWKEGKNPSKEFDNNFYLKTHHDVEKSKMNPLLHYITFGINEKREIKKVN